MSKVTATVTSLVLPTYREPAAEEMPMFAENRVHQRTSGNPYPNHIVLSVDRTHREDKAYTCVVLENEYLKLEILPELGGRIYSAYDKTTGYDFFYKQHVIKPALIGCLGSWVSGGMEFNYPFHHRASTFMPTDYTVEELEDGGAIVWLSEHDPIDRIKGMVGIVLRPGEAKFETRMRIFNRTDVRHPFLFWENTAVPVNPSYQIFYPKDVSYVNFHYKRSVTTYPVASNALGIFNGIRYEGDTDISEHKNTIQPTSYFCAPSEYDFFGGYDHGKGCGVVHIASHHTAPGKKMFTWAYNQLSTSWETALTDTDGAYAELMAGSYSDNQPDFTWIAPYETKCFSQHWYPIGKVGIPSFANLSGAIAWDESTLTIQTTKSLCATVSVTREGKEVFRKQTDFKAGVPSSFDCGLLGVGDRVTVTQDGKTLLDYTEKAKNLYNIPDTTEDMPNFREVRSADELYLEGVHVAQYRDPAVLPDSYWLEALKRDPYHASSLIAMAEFSYGRDDYEAALSYAKRAEAVLTKYNRRLESGRLYYIMGLILLALDKTDEAYDTLYKSAWCADHYTAAMTKLAAIDGARGEYDTMQYHAKCALSYQTNNGVAEGLLALAQMKNGDMEKAKETLKDALCKDPLNHLARYLSVLCGTLLEKDFYASLHSDPQQTCLDLAIRLYACGAKEEANRLLSGLSEKSPMVYYFLGDIAKAEKAPLTTAFPHRPEEFKLLRDLLNENPALPMAQYYYGCLRYAKRHYACAASHFAEAIKYAPDFYIPYRNLAVAYYSHLERKDEVLPLLEKALSLSPKNDQLVFEIAYVMGRLGVDPDTRAAFILENAPTPLRDDIAIELARAFNQGEKYDEAISLLKGHTFVPCEGGEHAVAEQYMFAHYAKGLALLQNREYEKAAQDFKEAQILPQNLGAGLWNECRLVPHKFALALCYEGLGRKEEAEVIYDYILSLTIDYFSNMHLPELPYYQAEAYKRKGDFLKGRALIDRYQRIWHAAIEKDDAGFFATTPFFLSYCEDPKEARRAYFSRLLGFAHRFMGEDAASDAYFAKAKARDKSNIWYTK